MPRAEDGHQDRVRGVRAGDAGRRQRRARFPRSRLRSDLRHRVRLPAVHPGGRKGEPGPALLRHHADRGAGRQHPELLRRVVGRPLSDRAGRRVDDQVERDRLRRGAADPDGDRRTERVHARRARGQSRRRGARDLDALMVRSAGREAGGGRAGRGRRRRDRPASGHAIVGAGRGREGRLGDRVGIGHDGVRPGQVPDRHGLGLVPVLPPGGRDGAKRRLRSPANSMAA